MRNILKKCFDLLSASELESKNVLPCVLSLEIIENLLKIQRKKSISHITISTCSSDKTVLNNAS